MGEVLIKDETPRDIWSQHAAILDAVASGNAAKAETLGRGHITQAANFMVKRLRGEREPGGAD
jgi:DNA-binding GntR family transcriptional regulator